MELNMEVQRMEMPCTSATARWWWGQGLGIQVLGDQTIVPLIVVLDPMSHCHEDQHSPQHLLRHSTLKGILKR